MFHATQFVSFICRSVIYYIVNIRFHFVYMLGDLNSLCQCSPMDPFAPATLNSRITEYKGKEILRVLIWNPHSLSVDFEAYRITIIIIDLW